MALLTFSTALRAALSGALLSAGAPAFAHHSYAMFDQTKTLTIEGTVKELQWTNPHIWVEVDVPPGPNAGHWSFEGATPALAKRSGWNKQTIKAGDKITVVANPYRDGRRGGSFLRFTLADGVTYYGGGRVAPPSEASSSAAGQH